MAVTNNLAVYKGESVVLPFVKYIAGTTQGDDITGMTIVFTLRLHPTAAAALLSVTATITSAGQGLYQIALTHAQTVLLAAGRYWYDIQRTDPGSEAVWSIGDFDVLQEVLYQ